MAYATLTEARHVLSSSGVDLRLDDGDDGSDAIEETDQEIEQATHYLYTAASLATSRWVKQKAKNILAYLLCTRRGNPAPAGIAERYVRALEQLERVRLGVLNIPGAVMSKAAVPTMSNMRPTMRPFPRSVVERQRSTGKAEGYQQKNNDPLDRTNFNLDYTI